MTVQELRKILEKCPDEMIVEVESDVWDYTMEIDICVKHEDILIITINDD